MMPLRKLGTSDLAVTPIALGCWPITGLTTLNTTHDESVRTIQAAVDAGINFLDTAYAYGIEGDSEQMIAEAIVDRREQVVIASKGGIHRVGKGQARDARPETLRQQCEESLQRLQTDVIDLYYLHARDPNVPVAESAGAISDLMAAGKVRSAGASNLTCDELQQFHDACPLTAVQPHFNMLQQEIQQDVVPWCRDHQVSLCVYWPLMKGLLAGRLPRDHKFDPQDGRAKYPMFQGEEWLRNQDFLDDLKDIAAGISCSVAELVIAWTIEQPGITAALCGAKRDWQIRETARAMTLNLSEPVRQQIDEALQRRGPTVSRGAV